MQVCAHAALTRALFFLGHPWVMRIRINHSWLFPNSIIHIWQILQTSQSVFGLTGWEKAFIVRLNRFCSFVSRCLLGLRFLLLSTVDMLQRNVDNLKVHYWNLKRVLLWVGLLASMVLFLFLGLWFVMEIDVFHQDPFLHLNFLNSKLQILLKLFW